MDILKQFTLLFCGFWLFTSSLSAQNPNWTAPNGAGYDFTASAISTIYLDDIVSNNEDDRVAFFVGNQIRGLSIPINIGNLGFRHFITLYSNEPTEWMDIKIYHAATDLVYNVATPLEFVVQGIYGSIDNPYELYVYANDDAPLNISNIPSQETIEGLAFGSIDLDEYLVQIDEQEVEWSFTPNSDLVVVLNDSLLSVEGAIGFTGLTTLTVKATELPITPSSQFAETTIEFNITPLYDAPAWNTIPSQSIVMGGQFTSVNLHDYEYQYQGDSILYDYAPVINESLIPDTIPVWTFNDNLPTNMTIVCRVDYTPKYQFGHPDDVLAGFIDGEIRGVATQNSINGLYFLTVAGSANETAGVTIKFYSGEIKKTFTLADEFYYEQHAIVGSVDSPYFMEIAPIVPIVPLNPVANGIAVMPVNILDPTFIGTEYFDFFAYDPMYPEYLNAVTQASFCVVADSMDLNIWYVDMDDDGLGDPDVFIYSCNIVDGYVDNGDDCDDNSTINNTTTISILESSGSTPNDGIICIGANVNLTVTAGTAYSWSDGQTTQTISIMPDSAATYSVTVTYGSVCKEASSTDILVEGKVVTNTDNDGFGTLRNVLACAIEGDTITFDQPAIDFNLITEPILLNINVNLFGLSNIQRPKIIVDHNFASYALGIASNKTFNLKNVDIKVINSGSSPTIVGPGILKISGITQIINQ